MHSVSWYRLLLLGLMHVDFALVHVDFAQQYVVPRQSHLPLTLTRTASITFSHRLSSVPTTSIVMVVLTLYEAKSFLINIMVMAQLRASDPHTCEMCRATARVLPDAISRKDQRMALRQVIPGVIEYIDQCERGEEPWRTTTTTTTTAT
jgi:hypothetical protein